MGGGMMVDAGCRATLRRVLFRDNRALTGGGLAVGSGARVAVEDCRAEKNVAVGSGGAFQVHDGGELFLQRCLIRQNHGGEGGALGIGTGRIEADACTLLANRAYYGGAMSVISGTGLLRNCLVRGNEATFVGGAVISTSAAAQLEACWIDSNLGAQGAARSTPTIPRSISGSA